MNADSNQNSPVEEGGTTEEVRRVELIADEGPIPRREILFQNDGGEINLLQCGDAIWLEIFGNNIPPNELLVNGTPISGGQWKKGLLEGAQMAQLDISRDANGKFPQSVILKVEHGEQSVTVDIVPDQNFIVRATS